MRFRYVGFCEICDVRLAAGTSAWFDPSRKKVRCRGCAEVSVSAQPAPPSVGTAGGSAAREYERRSVRHHNSVEAAVARDAVWREQVKKDHPLLGRVAAAVTAKPDVGSEPRHVAAWKAGADGERIVGAHLDQWARTMGGRALHDRRIPRTVANIDHIAINSSGVWVIDAKEYKGVVSAAGGGLFREPELRVAGRLRTYLADAVAGQMSCVAAALDAAAEGEPRPPVSGVLCFVGADWTLLGGTFTVKGVVVAWPSATIKLLTRSGRADQAPWLDHFTAVLAAAFPPA
jgi:hypothetical protein